MTAHFDDTTLLRYLREELSPEEQAAIDSHLEGCADRRCAEALERLARSPDLSLPLFLKTTPEGSGSGEVSPELPERYELLGVVGQGGMGLVVRVRDRVLNRELAVKTVRQRLGADDPRLRRFREEAHITAQLQHPGIPPVHELGNLPDGRPFFAMKLVKGQTLAARLQARSSPAEGLGEFLRVFEQICEALAYAHNHDVIHRDLKPSNVMIGAHGEVQVMDWGVAKKLSRGADLSPAGATTAEKERTVIDAPGRGEGHETRGALGTYAYMAPEQARGRARLQDERSDVFSLGALLCEILTGQPPYTGPGRTQLREQAEDVSLGPAYERLDRCGAHAELVALAKRCLVEERDDRPRDAAAAWQAVKVHREGEQERRRQAELQAAEERARAEKAEEVARAERSRADAERRARRRAVAVVTVGLLLLGSAAGGWWWLTERQAADGKAVEEALKERDGLRKEAFAAPVSKVEGLFQQAQRAADRAVKFAQGGYVSAELPQQAEEARVAADEDVKQAGKDRVLLARLVDIPRQPDTDRYQKDEKGRMMVVVPPSVDKQFAKAFRDWGLDIYAVPLAESVARFKARPNSVVQEVVAALDEWALQRRQDGDPKADWRKLHNLADQLDSSARRQQLRRLMAQSPLQLSLATLGRWVQARTQLRDRIGRVDPATAPVLEVISLARVLERFGDAAGAEGQLRAALATHPDEVVLLVALGRLLERLEPPRYGEAIECHRAARALRPDLGVALTFLLIESKRAAEAEQIGRDLAQRFALNPELHFYLGNALLDQRKPVQAEAAFRQAIELWPNSAVAYNHLGIALLDQQKPVEAEAAVRQAIELWPDCPEAYSNLGIALADQQKPAEAEAAFRQAIKLRPNYPDVYNNLGIVLAHQQKLAEAEAAYQQAIALRPNSPEAYSNLGTVLADQQKPAEAEAAYRQAIKLRPNPPNAYYNLGNALREQKKLREAEAAYRQAIKLRPKYPEAYYHLGVALADQQKPAEAEAAFRQAINLRPNYPDAYNNLGNALADQQKPVQAEAAYRQAIKLRPNSPNAYYNLGNALREQKKLGEAEAAYRQAIKLRPKSPDVYNNLGGILCQQQKLDEAVAAFRQAIKLRPKHSDAYYNLGVALAEQQKPAEAEATFRQAIALRPNFPEAYNNLGVVLFEQQQLDEAVAAYRRAIELRPDFPEAYTSLGNALARQQKLDEAVTAYRQAIKLRPNSPNTYNNLGNVLLAQKKPAEAEAAFRKAIVLRPHYPQAYFNLGISLADQKKLDEAVIAYRQAIERRPDYPEAYTNLGLALLDQKKPDEAVAAFRQAIALQAHFPEAYRGLGLALRDLKKLDEAVNVLRSADRRWPNHPLIRENLRRTERLLDLDGKVTAFLEGKRELETAAEHLQFAEFCHTYKDRHLTAVWLYAGAFRVEPNLLEDLSRQNRFYAACAAALALAGKGAAPPALGPEECWWLSAQARSWLQGDLARYAKDAQKNNPPLARLIVGRLRGWKQAEALAAVRDPKSLAGFPEEETREWLRLWMEVDALLERLGPAARDGK
ncbi:MAG: tetratricopeptide repeat protein [Gemmataceae bacterium]|nr:tetratricopeptide repeat protein [Gemmataceae bacterium]